MMKTYLTILASVLALGATTTGRNPSAPPLQIKGAKVATESDARRIAFKGYVGKMHLKVLATEGVRQFAIVRLGYDVPKFAAKGEDIWEARVTTLKGELRAILWVNPKTEKVYYVIGAWNNYMIGAWNIKVVQADRATIEKLTMAMKARMGDARSLEGKKGPQTLEEAAVFLNANVNMACRPGACMEHDGVFYFSGGRSTKRVMDFSSGFAIKKGNNEIKTWETAVERR